MTAVGGVGVGGRWGFGSCSPEIMAKSLGAGGEAAEAGRYPGFCPREESVTRSLALSGELL